MLRDNALDDGFESVAQTPIQSEPWLPFVEHVKNLATWSKVDSENIRLTDAFQQLNDYAMKCSMMDSEIGRDSLESDLISDMISLGYQKRIHYKEHLLATSKFNVRFTLP